MFQELLGKDEHFIPINQVTRGMKRKGMRNALWNCTKKKHEIYQARGFNPLRRLSHSIMGCYYLAWWKTWPTRRSSDLGHAEEDLKPVSFTPNPFGLELVLCFPAGLLHAVRSGTYQPLPSNYGCKGKPSVGGWKKPFSRELWFRKRKSWCCMVKDGDQGLLRPRCWMLPCLWALLRPVCRINLN